MLFGFVAGVVLGGVAVAAFWLWIARSARLW